MADYISREAVIEVLHYNSDESCASVVSDFEVIPTADVEPVRHGRWVLELTPYGKPYCFHCSACDDDFHCIGVIVASDYCPNCGAKMDLEDEK